jgi:hypothetical protein
MSMKLKRFIYELDKKDDKKLLEGLCLLTNMHGVSVQDIDGVVFKEEKLRKMVYQYPYSIELKNVNYDPKKIIDYKDLREKIKLSQNETLLIVRNDMGKLEGSLYLGRQEGKNPFKRVVYYNSL